MRIGFRSGFQLFALRFTRVVPICIASARTMTRTDRSRAQRHATCSSIGRRNAMSLVRLLGFTTLGCGCVVGRYREVATSREVTYVEEKGKSCGSHGHRRNHTIAAERMASPAAFGIGALTTKAS